MFDPRKVLTASLISLIVGLLNPAVTARAETTLERIQREGVVRIGFANEAPWAYLKPDGTLSGEAPTIMKIIAKNLGVPKVQGVLVEWGSLIPGLQSNRFDIVATAMFIKPQRCTQVAFTNPTVAVGDGFLVKKGNPLGLHSFADVAHNQSARLSILLGAVDLQYAHEAGVPDDRIVQQPDSAAQIEALRSGRVDAVAENAPTIQLYADRTQGEFEVAKPFHDTSDSIGYGAFAVRRSDTDLQAALNTQIAKFVGSDQHLSAVRQFGITRDEVPASNKTADVLCQGK